ncbi:MAG TPA: neuraminidase-like domain-containing protein [Solirubrobacteraceae bacterium]|nr:neuraminidase-like domain-containing protein [Solirubrobacteraceae bacterium]
MSTGGADVASGWQSLIGNGGLGTMAASPGQYTGDAGARLMTVVIPSGQGTVSFYINAVVLSGAVSVQTIRGTTIRSVLDLEPHAGNGGSGARGIALDLDADIDQVAVNATAQGTMIQIAGLAYRRALTGPGNTSAIEANGGAALPNPTAPTTDVKLSGLAPHDTKGPGQPINGGGPVIHPARNPVITIAGLTGLTAGVTATVSGTYTPGNEVSSGDDDPVPYAVHSIGVAVVGVQPATVGQVTPDPNHGTWAVSVTPRALVGSPPGFSLAASITSLDSLGRSHSAGSAPTAAVPVTDPGATLHPPRPGQVSATLVYHLIVEASSPVGIGLVVYSLNGGQTWTPLAGTNTSDPSTWEGDIALASNPVPVAGTIVPLVIGAYNRLESTSGAPPTNQSLEVTALDQTAPTLGWNLPAHDGEIVVISPNSDPDATVTIEVGVADDGGGVVSSGLATVEYSTDGVRWATLPAVTAADGSTTRTVDVSLSGLGAHVLSVRAADNAANSKTYSRTVSLQEAVALTVTKQDYLADLVDYARSRLVTAAGDAVEPEDLESALCQPLARLAGADGQARVPQDVAEQTIVAVRGAVEVLRAYLAGHSAVVGAQAVTDAVDESQFVASAYQAVLVALGTSYDELRAARGASDSDRNALAARLGIRLTTPRPDQLDQLLFALPSVKEADLQSLFGVAPTDVDALSSAPTTPLLLGWQQATLRSLWALEDYATTSTNDYTPAIVDPDLIGPADIANASTGQPAYDLLQARARWGQQQTTTLQGLRAGKTDSAGLLAMVSQVMGPDFDIQALATQGADGADVSATLIAEQLDQAGFDRLLALLKLATPGPLNTDEWDDACAILVEVQKVRAFPQWRQEEQQKALLLDPAVFNAGAESPALPAWLASPSARANWEDRLGSRVEQVANLVSGMSAAAQAADQAGLPSLRDALLGVIPTAPEELSRTLCIDLEVGPEPTTSRLDQAILAVQGLLAAIDAGGGMSGIGLEWTVKLPAGYHDLDQVFGDLDWMGQYSAWQSAMNVFLYPESHIQPGTRAADETTPAFQNLLASMSGSAAGSITEDGARGLAAAYWNDTSWNQAAPAWPANPPPVGYPQAPNVEWPTHGAPGDEDSPGLFPYDERLSESDLADLRDKTEVAQLVSFNSISQGTDGGKTPIDPWLREVLFDLPIQLALGLSQSNQWRAALDWLRIVYDPTQPTGGNPDKRWIFGGFAREPATEAITRAGTWLNGGAIDAHELAADRAHAYLRFTLLTSAQILCDWGDSEFSTDTAESRAQASSLYTKTLDVLAAPELEPFTGLAPNSELTALGLRASSGLSKLRGGMNISGLMRALAPIGGGADAVAPSPTNYRYTALIARAQQLITLASQMEASYLASLEKQDAEQYQQLLAQQDLGVTQLNSNIAHEQAQVAASDVTAAQLQVQKAQVQSDTYASWIAAGPNQYEQDQLTQIAQEKQFQDYASTAQAVGAILSATGQALGAGVGNIWGTGAVDVAGGIVNAIGISQAGNATQAALNAQADAANASLERSQQQWQLQKQSADEDAAIGRQQVASAQGRQQVADDQARLANLQQGNAQAKLQFLQTKLTNAALYAWMAGILGGVYSYLLQRAAAVARIAEQQLAFERQATIPGYIKTDYWSAPSGGSAPSTGTAGLTGSARLLEDVTQLDQYAADTNTRKLQLTQTFSLAQLAPVDLQRFREIGQLPFSIPLSSFGPPGTYMATIRAVRVSVAALVPPAVGVLGTLVGGGTSHIVIKNGTTFETTAVTRSPESIVITSPASASGVFSVDLTPDLELPWEGCGPDIAFSLELPQAINQFDYRTIADVQVSIDYTALYSPDYAAQVIRSLPTRISNSVALSLRDFADSWYQLLAQARAAQQAAPPSADALVARWPVIADAFPPSLTNLAVQQITLMVVQSSSDELSLGYLTRDGLPTIVSPSTTAAKTVQEIVSTRNGSGTPWNNPMLIGPSPVADWEIGLVADQPTLAAVAGGDIQDLVLVLTYGASLPSWPS